MRIPKNFIRVCGIASLAATLSFAQGPSGPRGRQAGPQNAELDATRHGRGWRLILALLDLTEEQRAAAKTIFETAYEQARPLREQIRNNRRQLWEAIKSNDTAAIGALSAAIGDLRGDLVEIHANALAQFYALLTDEQKAKLEKILDVLHGGSELDEDPSDL